jgi:hypothetical protein
MPAAAKWILNLQERSMSCGKKWVYVFLGILFCPYLLFAGTVRLINNAPYDLRGVIRGSDGSYLGEVIVKSQRETVWTDAYSQFGMYGGSNASQNQSSRSQTPYTVLWYCLDGGSYAVCDTVSTGAVVTSQGCAGARMCKPQNKTPYPPAQPEGQYLHKDPNAPPLNQ